MIGYRILIEMFYLLKDRMIQMVQAGESDIDRMKFAIYAEAIIDVVDKILDAMESSKDEEQEVKNED